MGPLVAAYVTAPVASTSQLVVEAKRTTPRRLPKRFDPQTTPDPDRWVPKRERAGFAEEVARRREQERGRRKGREREALLTQGATEAPAKAAGGGRRKQGRR